MKLFFRRIHLYLALAAGLVITVSCLTGACLVFEEALQHLFHHSRYFTTEGSRPLSVEALIATTQKALPQQRVTAVKIYADKARTAELSLAEKEATVKRPANGRPARKDEGGTKAFVNRYTGGIAEVYEYRKSGFYTIFALHRWLLGGPAGKLIVGISTFIFLFILMTGVVLWWPRNRAILRQRMKLKWRAGWKRLNHDYHVVFGFYSAIFLFIFAFTGLAWSFEWFNKGIYTLTGSSQKPPPQPQSILPSDALQHFPANAAWRAIQELEPAAGWYNIMLPQGDSAALIVTVLPATAQYEAQTTAYHFDQYSGTLLQRVRFADRNAGQRVRAMFKPVHTGAIWGWPSKIVALIACLLGGLFPLSGYLIWINRTWKRRRKKIIPVRQLA